MGTEQMTIDDLLPNPFFGKPWDAPITDDAEQVPTPVGSSCIMCEEPIEDGDRGFITCYWSPAGVALRPVHAECQNRPALGGANHTLGPCSGCGGDDAPDPPGVTRRQAAILAVSAWEDRYGQPLIRDRD